MHNDGSRGRMTTEMRFKKDGKEADWLGEEGSRKTIGPK